MRLKKREVELKQRVKVSLAKYVGMFCHDCSNIRFVFMNTKPHIFRISRKQNISNTPSRHLNFVFTIEALSNINCLQGRIAAKQLHCRLILATLIGFKIVRSRT